MNLLSFKYVSLAAIFILLSNISSVFAQCPPISPDFIPDNLSIEVVKNETAPIYHFEVCNKPRIDAISDFARYLYFWDFGDGTYSTEEKPFHGYLSAQQYRVSVQLVIAYANPKGAFGTMRTSRPYFGEETPVPAGSGSVNFQVEEVVDSYMLEDGYQPFSLEDSLIDFRPAFDLVPGYLTPFIISFAHPGSEQTREIILTFPDNMFSDELSFSFFNPEEEGVLASSDQPQNSPPEFANIISPATINHEFSQGETGGRDSVKFSVNFPANTEHPLHVFASLFASPFIPLGEDVDFEIFMLPPTGDDSRGGTPSDTALLEKGVKPSGSHDPNYKKVYFEHYAFDEKTIQDKLYVAGNTANLVTFEIEFQNEGDAPEATIKIIDTIAPEINFSTIQLLGIDIADGNIPQSICDYPPIWRDKIWDTYNPADSNHYYKMTKNPTKRTIQWELETYLPGVGMTDEKGDSIDVKFTKGIIRFQAYTHCGLQHLDTFTNRASVYFGEQDPVTTNPVEVISLCFGLKSELDKGFTYTGDPLLIDLKKLAEQYYPNSRTNINSTNNNPNVSNSILYNRFDPASIVITRSSSQRKLPFKPTLTGSTFKYEPDPDLVPSLASVAWSNSPTKKRLRVDNLEYIICDLSVNQCVPVSVYILIDENPDNSGESRKYSCPTNCTEAEAYKEPYPKWWYALLGIFILFLLIISAIRRRRKRRRRN